MNAPIVSTFTLVPFLEYKATVNVVHLSIATYPVTKCGFAFCIGTNTSSASYLSNLPLSYKEAVWRIPVSKNLHFTAIILSSLLSYKFNYSSKYCVQLCLSLSVSLLPFLSKLPSYFSEYPFFRTSSWDSSSEISSYALLQFLSLYIDLPSLGALHYTICHTMPYISYYILHFILYPTFHSISYIS